MKSSEVRPVLAQEIHEYLSALGFKKKSRPGVILLYKRDFDEGWQAIQIVAESQYGWTQLYVQFEIRFHAIVALYNKIKENGPNKEHHGDEYYNLRYTAHDARGLPQFEETIPPCMDLEKLKFCATLVKEEIVDIGLPWLQAYSSMKVVDELYNGPNFREVPVAIECIISYEERLILAKLLGNPRFEDIAEWELDQMQMRLNKKDEHKANPIDVRSTNFWFGYFVDCLRKIEL
jgi:hypothetical protein